ncbi:hypothetical protein [uncultured Sphingobacterium sp.]|uniref:hypothetical protein n=1 Tax=uncultured Sphingobacterium sp. TaxID=182688 RepID=UPI0025DAAE65|nr:hypothetical protein [uncultured Sphingobacterium sp.]
MKLTKAKLIAKVKAPLEKLGYIIFKDPISSAQGFFSKKLDNGLYLTLGLTISRHMESNFTGSFYYSKTTRWAAVWDDIPEESYVRPGFLMSTEERKIYFKTENEQLRDYWWDGLDDSSVASFIEVIKLTESRLYEDRLLTKKIEDSLSASQMKNYADEVNKSVFEIEKLNFTYSYLPDKEVSGIPMRWFKASEYVLKKHNGILNKNTVKILASDAFIQSTIDNL